MIHRIKSLLGNRNAVLILALILGLLWGKGARWSEGITLPALALVMTLATMVKHMGSDLKIELIFP